MNAFHVHVQTPSWVKRLDIVARDSGDAISRAAHLFFEEGGFHPAGLNISAIAFTRNELEEMEGAKCS